MGAPAVENAVNAHKADLSYSYIDGQGGAMTEAQATEFVELIASQPGLLSLANIIIMKAQKQHIPAAGFVGRVSYPDRPGQPTTEAERSRLTISDAVLDAKDFRAATFLDYKVQNNNIMRWGLAGFVQRDLARAVGLDVEDNALNGDTASLDEALALFNGLIKQVASPIDMSATPVPMTDYVFYVMRQALPKQFLRDIPNLVYLVSPHADGAYQMYCKNNPNALGTENKYQSPDMMGKMTFMGSPIVPIPGMPDDVAILTHKSNLNVGFWVQMFLESDHDPDAGVDKFILRYSCDAKYTFAAGAVCFKGIEIGIFPSLG